MDNVQNYSDYHHYTLPNPADNLDASTNTLHISSGLAMSRGNHNVSAHVLAVGSLRFSFSSRW